MQAFRGLEAAESSQVSPGFFLSSWLDMYQCLSFCFAYAKPLYRQNKKVDIMYMDETIWASLIVMVGMFAFLGVVGWVVYKGVKEDANKSG